MKQSTRGPATVFLLMRSSNWAVQGPRRQGWLRETGEAKRRRREADRQREQASSKKSLRRSLGAQRVVLAVWLPTRDETGMRRDAQQEEKKKPPEVSLSGLAVG
ncbi:hypothetical protein TEQG_05904 [Trichophyton equinum CBS 127.97]|uniref:Uncharacterized protein n=1 Tax=Trichophyton equinum (strain ATCC MYA-4606 / CBS 127.97) TaxID=559882 RepID=F2PY81_TRIEC|nr:hypothetical protein TEQG_05904 [Trichophyton equinum CBS 127.97]